MMPNLSNSATRAACDFSPKFFMPNRGNAPSLAGLSPPSYPFSGPLVSPACTPVPKKKRLATKRCRKPTSFCCFKKKNCRSVQRGNRPSDTAVDAIASHTRPPVPCLFPHWAWHVATAVGSFSKVRTSSNKDCY